MSGDEKSILVVDDEPEIRRALEMSLTNRGYEVVTAENGEEALDLVASRKPDLVILDLALPGISGFEVCQRLRTWTQIPIIVLSVRDSERDKIAALDLGADDYLTKPFGTGELLARMRTAFRHVSAQSGDVTCFENRDLRVNFTQRQVTVRGQEVKLTPKELDLLYYLVSHADCIATHAQLLMAVWGKELIDDRPLLRVHIANLRQKIEPQPSRPIYIVNEPGVGYRFTTAVESFT